MSSVKILEVYNTLKKEYPQICLDELLYKIYNQINVNNKTFDSYKKEILKVLNIDEYMSIIQKM